MPDPARSARAARALFDAHQARETFADLPGDRQPRDMDEAYAIQDELVALWQEAGRGTIGGYKIGVTSPAIQAMVGLDQPIVGAVFAPTIQSSPGTVRGAEYGRLGIECEIAVKIGRDLPPAGAPFDRAALAEAVDACMAAFEVIDDRDADYRRLNALSLIADNSWNAGVVLGPEMREWRALDLAAVAGALTVNGEAAGEGVGGDALGHPLDSAAWLANNLAGRGRTLAAGMIVMTGSIIATKFPKPGDEARFAVAGLGEGAVRVI